MKKDGLKKHHFWVLLGAVPLLIFILFLLLITEPAGAVEEATKAYDKSLKDTQAQKPFGKGVIDDLDRQRVALETRRDELWKANYERQRDAGVFAWPRVPRATRDPALDALEKLDLRFGAKKVEALDANAPADRQFVERNDELQKFTDAKNYFDAYKALADGIAPTLFEKAAWTGVLRYVSDWKTGRPPYEQFWLALEDYWIQKALLTPIAEVNASIAKFEDVTPKGETKAFHFQSRIWDVNLEFANDSGAMVLKSKLKNRTDRLQLLGTGKSMRLNVWLDDPARAQPFEYRIEGETVRGHEEITPRFVPALHRLPAGTAADKIYKVEQVFDTSTVPVRLVRRIDLGFTDSKRHGTELKPPKFLEDEAVAAQPTTSGEPPRPPEYGGTVTATAGVASPSGPKTGTHDEVLLGNKKRYLEVTEQIRRMPVAIVIVVDQAYYNDVLVAYSNSPLRFHTTQVQMQRFRESLPVPLPANGAVVPGPGPGPGHPLGEREPGTATGTSLADNQATAGLAEVAIYGIVTFYEKYVPKAATAPTPTTAPVPAPVPAPKTDTKPTTTGS